MVAVPAAMAVTRPVPETVATEGAELDQLIARPVRTVPEASVVVAASWSAPPVDRFSELGETVTAATGAGAGGAETTAVAVKLPVPDTLSLVAVIVTWPAATAVTRPAEETVATELFEEVQDTARLVSVLPLASSVWAVNWVAAPTVVLVLEGLTTTAATGTGFTFTEDVALLPPPEAVIVAEPDEMPVTMPLETVATAGLEEVQVMGTEETTVPFESSATPEQATVCAMYIAALVGVREILFTSCVTRIVAVSANSCDMATTC